MRIVYILFFILFVLMLVLGGERGVKSFITLVCNVFIGAISIFLLLIGVSPYLIIIVSSLVFCLVTIKFQNGLNIKTVSSLISVLMVCIFSCVIIYIFSIKGHIGGFNEIEMQEELAEYLNKEGYNVTQATVSRDIRELKLSKIQTENGGQKYAVFHPQTAFNDKYTRILHDSFVSMDMAQNILVIKTVSGMAMAVAAALDAIHFSEIVGCIAGDDTVMCAVRTVDDTIVLMDKIRKLIAG